MMNRRIQGLLGAFAFAGSLAILTGCDVDVEDAGEPPSVDVSTEGGNLPEYEVRQTEEGSMPDVDIDAEPGRMPDVEVRGPEFEVESETVTVPDVDVSVDEQRTEVPTLDVELPDEQGR